MINRVAAANIPTVFISHGSPMVALQHGPYQDALAQFGRTIQPNAIIAVSAHWSSSASISITGVEIHTTIHDFGGFPAALYDLTYNAPGSPALAERITKLLSYGGWDASIDTMRGLDHGVWIPLHLMYPSADIPVVALSIPLQLSPEVLFRIGEALAALRGEGVLLLGSGGVVHNLRLAHLPDTAHPPDAWASEFEGWVSDAVEQKKLNELFHFRETAPHAQLAVPTFEHFAPVFVALGAGSPYGRVRTIYQGFEHGNLSMRSFAIT